MSIEYADVPICNFIFTSIFSLNKRKRTKKNIVGLVNCKTDKFKMKPNKKYEAGMKIE